MPALVVVLIPVVFYLLRKIGDVIPGLIFLGLGILAMFVVPKRLPVDWQTGLIFGVPLFAACVYKAIRGDKYRVKGSRLP